jgi:hypothetical protein
MAARKASTRRQKSSASESAQESSGETSSRHSKGADYHMEMGSIRQWFSNPAVRYVAGGIATAVIAKLATNMSDKYPSLASFLRESLDSVEEKLAEFNDMSGNSSGGRARRTASMNTIN